jgi:hypothetical protein
MALDRQLTVTNEERNAVPTSYSSLQNKLVSAECDIDFAYHDAGQGELPPVPPASKEA